MRILVLLFSLGVLRSALGAEVPTPAQAAPGAGLVVPAGTVLNIRIRQPLSSYSTRRDTPILAEVIAPVEVGGKTLLPMRTRLTGRVRDVRRVSFGFSRETALLDLEFNRLQLPGEPERNLAGVIQRVDDARERVDDKGRIHGIRATNTFTSTLTGAAIAVSAIDPMALMFGVTSSLSIFRLPDSSIIFPAGTELQFKIGADIAVNAEAPPQYPALFRTGMIPDDLGQIVRTLPFRTATENDGQPSDLTSLLYVGSKDAIERAFLAAGWVRSDRLDAQSTFGVMRSIIENQGYRAAPMSVLVLDGKTPEFTYAKTLNTFFSRHHLRIYAHSQSFQGRQIWSSTGTYDSGIGFSKAAKTFIHIINENIDEERQKIVNDLVLTGCVDGVGYIDRPWVPLDAKNATGDSLRTDGRMAVLEINDCGNPSRANLPEAGLATNSGRQSSFLRPFRAAVLTLRNDVTRGNAIYQAYSATRIALKATRKSPDSESPRSVSYGGQDFLIVSGARPFQKKLGLPPEPGHKVNEAAEKARPVSYISGLMFSLNSGLSGYGNSRFSTVPIEFQLFREDGSLVGRVPFPLENSLERGWTIAPKVTLNTWRRVSNEFSYSRTLTNFRVTGHETITNQTLDLRAKGAIRAFSYNALFHLRPNGSRFRPYVAAGPAIQLIHLTESSASTNSLLKFAVRDVAFLVGAYNFGSKPFVQGGGVFLAGANYGGGAYFHLTPRLFLRADFRETITPQPDFWKSSGDDLAKASDDPRVRLLAMPLVKHGPLRHQLVTLGIGIAF